MSRSLTRSSPPGSAVGRQALGEPVRLAPGLHVLVDRVSSASSAAANPDDRTAAATLAPWRAQQYLAARALLRRLLRSTVGQEAAQARIATTTAGKPYLPAFSRIGISLSHDGDLAAAAVAVDAAVGVDVQQPVPVNPWLLRRCTTQTARAVLSAMPQEQSMTELAWIWSVQEACVKAAGSGLGGLPWTIPVESGQKTGRWQAYTWLALRDRFAVPVSCAYRSQPPEGSATDDAA